MRNIDWLHRTYKQGDLVKITPKGIMSFSSFKDVPLLETPIIIIKETNGTYECFSVELQKYYYFFADEIEYYEKTNDR